MTTEERLKHWEAVLQQQEESGLTKKDFCQEQDIPIWQFYDWRKKVMLKNGTETGFSKISSVPAKRCISSRKSSGLVLRFASGLEAELAVGFDEGSLKSFLKVASSC